MKYINEVVDTLIQRNAVRATKYISPKEVITATRRMFDRRLPRKGENLDIILKIGRPNYQERDTIRIFKKAGQPFPVKMIIFKPYVPKKK